MLYALSSDAGRSFAPPRPITASAESQRFDRSSWMRMDPCSRPGWTSAIACKRRRETNPISVPRSHSPGERSWRHHLGHAHRARQHVRMLPSRDCKAGISIRQGPQVSPQKCTTVGRPACALRASRPLGSLRHSHRGRWRLVSLPGHRDEDSENSCKGQRARPDKHAKLRNGM